MAFWDSFRRQRSTKGAALAPAPASQRAPEAKDMDMAALYAEFVGGATVVPQLTEGSNFTQCVTYGFKRNPVVQAACNYIASAAAAIPWLYFAGTDDDEIELDADLHPIARALEKPNPDQTRPDFVRRYVLHMLLGGNAYIQSALPVIGTEARRPELYLLRPDTVTILPRRLGDEKKFLFMGENNTPSRAFDGTELLHIPYNNLLDDYGVAPAAAAARSINQNNLARTWNSNLIGNSGRPPAIATTETSVNGMPINLTEEDKRAIQQELNYWFSNANVGRVPVLEGIKLQEFGMTPAEMSWIEGLNNSSREICMAFGVAPELVGDSRNKTYSNYQEARKALYQDTVIPLLELLVKALNGWLGVWDPTFEIRLNLDDVTALNESMNDRFARANAAMFGLTVDERRSITGYDALPNGEGNVVLLPGGLQRLQDLQAVEMMGSELGPQDMPPYTGLPKPKVEEEEAPEATANGAGAAKESPKAKGPKEGEQEEEA